MPKGKRNGSKGLGTMTGRSAGYCAGYNQPGFMNPALGLRLGGGRDRGRGFKTHQPHPAVQNNDSPAARQREINYLEQEKEILKEELTAMENRIAKLKQENEAE